MNYLIILLQSLVDLMEKYPYMLPVKWEIKDHVIYIRIEVKNKKQALSYEGKIFLHGPNLRQQITQTIAEIEEALYVDAKPDKLVCYIDECKDLNMTLQEKIEAYIKKQGYTWTFAKIMDEYKKQEDGCYVSYTARDIINNVIVPHNKATNDSNPANRQ